MKPIDSWSLKCVGCGSCVNVCPVKCISLKPYQLGHAVAVIDEDICIKCGSCERVCQINKEAHLKQPISVQSYVSQNKSALMSSSSGAFFQDLARYFIENGGVVYGASFSRDNKCRHIRIDNENLDELNSVIGSKYVYSDISNIYKSVLDDIRNNKNVLFSGVPCQNAALQLFLGPQADSVFYVDLICHGTPSQLFLDGYLSFLSLKYKSDISSIAFRSKHPKRMFHRTSFFESVSLFNGKKMLIPYFKSYYYSFFLTSESYKEQCYYCKYAKKDRTGDFTIGDFWNLKMSKRRGDTKFGSSMVLINSKKGLDLIERFGTTNFNEQDLNFAIKTNKQLKTPSNHSNIRSELVEMFKTDASGFDYNRFMKKKMVKFILLSKLKYVLPRSIKRFLKKA